MTSLWLWVERVEWSGIWGLDQQRIESEYGSAGAGSLQVTVQRSNDVVRDRQTTQSRSADRHSKCHRAFRDAFNVLDRRIRFLLCLPLDSLDKLTIQKEIDRIGKAMPGLKAHA